MTFSCHSISDQRAESVNAGKSEGKGTIPQAIPSIFQGDAPKWEEGILRLYRECWGEEGKREHRTQNGEGFTAMMANLIRDVQLMGAGNKMHACVCLLQSQVCHQCNRQRLACL